MNRDTPLFPTLLGAAFERLDAPVQALHRGVPMEYIGIATVERGSSWLARIACIVAGLPVDVKDAPLRFRLSVDRQGEEWVRFFSGSAPMSSRVWAKDGCLVERLGPSVTRFRLTEQGGVLNWRSVSLHVLRIPIPRWAFEFQARVCARDTRYRFEIDARLALVGTLIRYEGELDVGR